MSEIPSAGGGHPTDDAVEATDPTTNESANTFAPLGEGRVVIAMILHQEAPTEPVNIDFSVEVFDADGTTEVGGAKPIHAEQANLLGALSTAGDYLKMMSRRLSYRLIDQASKDPNLAKHLGLETKKDV